MRASKRSSGVAGFLITTIAVLGAVSVGGTSLEVSAQTEGTSTTRSTTTQTTVVDTTAPADGSSTGAVDLESSSTTIARESASGSSDRSAQSTTESQPAEASSDIVARRGDRGSTVAGLQRRLNQFGFDAGPIDGIYGSKTAAGVSAFQAAVGLPRTGVYDRTTASALAGYTPSDSGGQDPAPTMSLRKVQQLLNGFGFDAGPVDGLYGPRTRAGLLAFQRAVGLTATGRLDQATATALAGYTPSDSGGQDPAPTMSLREAQQLLNGFGFDAGPVDGLYGPRTRAGLLAFQRAVDVSTTGRLDQATIAALRSYDGGGDDGGGAVDARSMTVRQIQQALADGPFDPGLIDGRFGTKTRMAVWALEKLAGLPMDGNWGNAEQAALRRVNSGAIGGPRNSYGRRWVEIDLSQQLVMVYDPGRTVPRLVTHTSTGSGNYWRSGPYSGRSITPTGRFTIFRRISGWHYSTLGLGGMYNPLYITSSGIALHGSSSVPSYPASHGCIRLPMHIAQYMPSLLPNGTPVVIRQ